MQRALISIALMLSVFMLPLENAEAFGRKRKKTKKPVPVVSPSPLPTFSPLPAVDPNSQPIRFAVIGDYGRAGERTREMSNLVKGWNPELIITTGDNNYPNGAADTIDANVGQYYGDFIFPYFGSYPVSPSTTNRFFPTLGNHDWETAGARPYLDYFTLPGNERYYDFVSGPVHFFAIDSDRNEPDGTFVYSPQANWLRNGLAASRSPFRIVYMHHGPHSSALNGSNTDVQWPFSQWGANAVIAGHDHTYERINRDGIVYFVNGTGGHSLYSFASPVVGSQVRYNSDHGAMLVEREGDSLVFRFINRLGAVIDSYRVGASFR